MNSIKENIFLERKKKNEEIVEKIKFYKKQRKTLLSIIEGIVYNDNFYKYSKPNSFWDTYDKANKAMREINAEIDNLYNALRFSVKDSEMQYEIEINRIKMISNYYKPKNKLMIRRPL